MSKVRKCVYTCPLCHGHTSTDTEFLLYKSPDNIPDTCCVNCFDEIVIAYNKIIQNMKNRGRFVEKLNRERKLEQREQRLLNNLTNSLINVKMLA